MTSDPLSVADRASEGNDVARLPPIKGFQKSSLVDWPGKVAAVVFLPGCNLACRYCHNWSLVVAPESHQDVPWPEIERHLADNLDFLDGVCVTGGEPTLHDGLPHLLRHMRSLGLATKLDTNGTKPEAIAAIISSGLVDFIAMDFKAPLEDYKKLVGDCDTAAISSSARLIIDSRVEHEFRLTVVPGFHDEQSVERAAISLGKRANLVLQQLVAEKARDRVFCGGPKIDAVAFDKLVAAAAPHVRSAAIRGEFS
jgi:pyruvate formate lyase activating enzyme